MEYCSVHPSWQFHRDLSSLVRYTVVTAPEEWSEEKKKHDDNISVSSPNNVEFLCDKGDSNLEISIVCKRHYAIQLLGAEIISDVRTVECYGKHEGYLGTSRGMLLDIETENSASLYHCSLKFEESVQEITLKFLGLGDKTTVTVYKLSPVLLQTQSGQNLTSGSPGKLDLTKVKGYLHSMGDSIPDGAAELLQSVEQFQSTQMGGLQQLQSMFTQLSMSKTGQNSNPVSMENEHELRSKESRQNSEIHSSLQQNSQSLEQKFNLGPLQAMMATVARSQGQDSCQGDSEGEGFMYDMLKNICGRVSDMRASEKENVPVITSERARDASSASSDVKDSPHSVTSSLSSEDVQSIVQATMKQTEERLVIYINDSLTAMEERLTSKLDSFMSEMQKHFVKQYET